MLAHTYYSLKRFPEAVGAYERAAKLLPDNADLLADYADALGAATSSLDGKPTELIERALKANPTQWKALALAGTVAFNRKDYKQAVAYWEQLKRDAAARVRDGASRSTRASPKRRSWAASRPRPRRPRPPRRAVAPRRRPLRRSLPRRRPPRRAAPARAISGTIALEPGARQDAPRPTTRCSSSPARRRARKCRWRSSASR